MSAMFSNNKFATEAQNGCCWGEWQWNHVWLFVTMAHVYPQNGWHNISQVLGIELPTSDVAITFVLYKGTKQSMIQIGTVKVSKARMASASITECCQWQIVTQTKHENRAPTTSPQQMRIAAWNKLLPQAVKCDSFNWQTCLWEFIAFCIARRRCVGICVLWMVLAVEGSSHRLLWSIFSFVLEWTEFWSWRHTDWRDAVRVRRHQDEQPNTQPRDRL